MTVNWISPSLSAYKAWYIYLRLFGKHDNLPSDFYFGTIFWTILVTSCNLSRLCFDRFIVLRELSRTRYLQFIKFKIVNKIKTQLVIDCFFSLFVLFSLYQWFQSFLPSQYPALCVHILTMLRSVFVKVVVIKEKFQWMSLPQVPVFLQMLLLSTIVYRRLLVFLLVPVMPSRSLPFKKSLNSFCLPFLFRRMSLPPLPVSFAVFSFGKTARGRLRCTNQRANFSGEKGRSRVLAQRASPMGRWTL